MFAEKSSPQQMTMHKLEKILEKLDPSLFETVANKCPYPSPQKVMILINTWVLIRISVVHASLYNQCDIPKTILWLHAFYFTVTYEWDSLMNILDCTAQPTYLNEFIHSNAILSIVLRYKSSRIKFSNFNALLEVH